MAESVAASVVLPSAGAPAGVPAGAPAGVPAGAPAGAPAGVPAGVPACPGPDAYKDRSYIKGLDSNDKVWEMLDNSQKLIGQRPAGIPAADAPKEVWDNFYKAMGRPEKAADYQFELDPSLKLDEKFVNSTKEIMHKYGLTPTQAKGIQKDFDAMMVAVAKERGVALQQQNTDFNKLATETFGADRDKAIATAKGLLDQFTPANIKPELAKLSNENLIVLASVLNGINAKYIKADGAPSAPPGSMGGKSGADLRSEGQALMATKAYTDAFHPDHAKTVARIAEIY